MDENRLRSIVTRILLTLEKEGYFDAPAKERRPDIKGYVLCEAGREKEFLDFLRRYKNSGCFSGVRLTAVLETPDDQVIDALLKEQLCQVIASEGARDDAEISIYPSVGRAALCAAGLGMDNTFVSRMLRKDMETGRKSVVISGGLEPFTGLEPEFYQKLILSYVKNLMLMNVRFVNDWKDILSIVREEQR